MCYLERGDSDCWTPLQEQTQQKKKKSNYFTLLLQYGVRLSPGEKMILNDIKKLCL